MENSSMQDLNMQILSVLQFKNIKTNQVYKRLSMLYSNM